MKNKVLCTLFVLFFTGTVNATYTDYIGAGHHTGVTVTASSVDDEATAQKTVDGSGLSGPSGTHDTDWANHWLGPESSSNPNPARSSYGYWIQYDFGEVYNFSNMWVWNYNEGSYSSRGLKNVIIDYSTDGSSWTELNTTQFPEASGSGSYTGFTNSDLNFDNASARYVLISAIDNWGGSFGYGLAEVKFNIATAKASSPTPFHTATGVHPEQDISWTAGIGADSHDVYFGTDPTPDSGEYQGNRQETNFEPGTMAYNTTYYWRIDEVDGGTTTGDVWSFTTGSNKASNPSPSDTATGQSTYVLLSWEPSVDAVSHDVYFGTDPTPDAGEFQDSQTETTFNPGALEYEMTYYWRIDEYNGDQTFTGDLWSFTTGPQAPFAATGRTSPYQAPPPEPVSFPAEEAAVDVTFDRLPTKMRFVMCSFPSIMTESDMHYNSGYLETYDPERVPDDPELFPEVSWEACADHNVQYNRMWIESQNEARILVKVIAAMKLQADYDLIAHTDYYSGSPWGDHCTLPPGVTVGYGDWSEETYYIYPDGTHTRYAKCYTPFAEEPGLAPFGYDRWPPNYIYEFFEGTVFVNEDQEASDVLDPDETLTLIRMNGESDTISYVPNYPDDFGSFDNANIAVIGLKSIFRPFIIGMPTNVEVRPYPCEGCTDFIRWDFPEGGCVTPWGHMINWDIYEITSNTIAQVYLQGVTDAADPSSELPTLAKSWVNPPAMSITCSGFTGGTYERKERAYKVTQVASGNFECTLAGSSANPVVNPAIVIEDWGQDNAVLYVNGSPYTGDHRVGYEGDNLVVWMDYESASSVNLEITRIGCPDIDRNGDVNFVDYSLFAEQWMRTDCNDCNGTDFSGDGDVNLVDLDIFTDNWLRDYTLVGYWKLDNDANDYSGYGHHGTLAGDSHFINDPNRDYVLTLDGSGDYVSADNICQSIAGDDVTLLAWINSDSTASQQFFIAFNQSNGVNRLLMGHQEGNDFLQLYDDGWHDFSGPVVFDGQWHCIVCVLSDSTNTVDLYVDGAYVDSLSSTVSISASDFFSLGQEYDSGPTTSDFYEGLIDDVRVYNRTLSEDEIQTLADM